MEVNWKLSGKIPFKLEGFSTVRSSDGEIYFFGGVDGEMMESGDLYVYKNSKFQKHKLFPNMAA